MAGNMQDNFDENGNPIRCSFCGKEQGQVRRLVKGPTNIFICDECVSECSAILEESIARDLMAQGGYTGLGDLGFMQPEAEPEPEPDPEGTVTWGNLDDRIRAESLNARILIENITGIEDIDYDQMYEDLRRQLNDIAQAQWMMILMGAGQAADALDQSYDSLRDVFDSIKDGELQADNADVVWQLEDTVNQVVSGGENLYITLVGLEQQAADGQRGLDTIDRNLEQLRLRQQLGQVSQQTVTELEQTRAQTVSQLATLDSNIRQLKIQLQNLIGEDPTGELVLGPLPTQEEMVWEEPDYEADLEAAKAASWTLRSAQKALEDAEEDWKDARSDYRSSRKQYLLQQAEHTWNAAQLTYQSTVQNFETSFKSLYDALANYEQLYASAQSAMVWQQSQLDTVQTRYDLGLTTCSAVLDAQDEVASAQSALDSAWRDLFSACNSYRWAVEYGLLPAQGA